MTLDQGFETLKTLVDVEVRNSRNEGERKAVDGLNQTVRRLRKAETESDIAGLLVNSSEDPLESLTFEGRRARVGSSTFALEEAPALLSVIESNDTVVTLADSRELSETLASHLDWEGKAQLVPVVVDRAVRIVLLAPGDVPTAPLELLCEVAGLRLETLAKDLETLAKDEAPQFVQIVGAKTSTPKWEELPPAEQSAHLRAQRFAQVAVARMRVEQSAAVQEGLQQGDLYSALRSEIDRARAEYRRQFLTGDSKTMVDYLYLELVRSLANDEDRLLGAGFPGRLT